MKLKLNETENRPKVPGDLLQNSSQCEKKDEKSLFQLLAKRHTTRFQSSKPSWEPIDKNENRYACLARPDIEESYASLVKTKTQSLTIPSKVANRIYRQQHKKENRISKSFEYKSS